DVNFTACFSDVEISELRREACIEARVSGGVKSEVAVPEDVARSDELRRHVVYALLNVISVPDRVKWRVTFALHELHSAGLLRVVTAEPGEVPPEVCLATAMLVPPVVYEDAGHTYMPCYVRALEVSERPELEIEGERIDGRPYFRTVISRGEMSYALFKVTYEAASKLSRLAGERGVSVAPIVYIDDAFEGLDMAKMRNLLSRDYNDASIYAATHRLEAGTCKGVARVLLLTYGTKASQLVDQTEEFRFALVDEELIEERKEILEDVSSKLIEGCELDQLAVVKIWGKTSRLPAR
ncbi:MAG: hypothetical protein LM577_08255, partial [Thermoproteaceae archaeon]|nr:hypothetical protein [Thermoproteaceae archaeon]